MQGLPVQQFYTIKELSKRWGKDVDYINYLIETKQIIVGDKHAALQGRRFTVFKGVDPSDFDNNIEKLRNNSDEEIVTVSINDSQVPYWDSLIQRAKDALPDTSIQVVFISDILEFEKKHLIHSELNVIPKTKNQQRCLVILNTISQLGFDKLNIPDGGKSTIKEKCLKNSQLFTSDTFDKAWQEGLDEKLFKMAKHNLYSNKYTR